MHRSSLLNFPNARSPSMSPQPSLAQQFVRHYVNQVSLSYSSAALAPSSFPSRPGSSILIDCRSEGSLTAENHAPRWTGKNLTGRYRRQVFLIDMLPDDVLLEIFDFYMAKSIDGLLKSEMKAWQTLVHVCRRWRSVVFGSPRRLNLRLVCTGRTLVRETLDVWPALPLVIEEMNCGIEGVDNILAFLERSDRVCQIDLWGVYLEDISEAMQVPFPELTYLLLHHSDDETEPVIPLSDSFLGGSAPRLQSLELDRIPFPGLPKLLSSATHLIDLSLLNIPHSGYISPEAMVACLSISTSLRLLTLEFQSPQSRPDRESQRPPPPKRAVLPVLTTFTFSGVGEYLDDLVAHVDAPRLDCLEINFFNDIVFDTPQFTRFITGSRTPTLEAFDKASVSLGDTDAGIVLSSISSGFRELNVSISCKELGWQVSALEQVCTSFLPLLSTLEDLYIYGSTWPQDSNGNVDSLLWLELLHLFTTVKNLYLSEEIALCIVLALKELVGARTTEVFPTLQNIYLEGLQPSGPVEEGVRKFVAARQVTPHSITVYRWDRRLSPINVLCHLLTATTIFIFTRCYLVSLLFVHFYLITGRVEMKAA